jgi:hypothetical protein
MQGTNVYTKLLARAPCGQRAVLNVPPERKFADPEGRGGILDVEKLRRERPTQGIHGLPLALEILAHRHELGFEERLRWCSWPGSIHELKTKTIASKGLSSGQSHEQLRHS